MIPALDHHATKWQYSGSFSKTQKTNWQCDSAMLLFIFSDATVYRELPESTELLAGDVGFQHSTAQHPPDGAVFMECRWGTLGKINNWIYLKKLWTVIACNINTYI